jgi:hypothetical protein
MGQGSGERVPTRSLNKDFFKQAEDRATVREGMVES